MGRPAGSLTVRCSLLCSSRRPLGHTGMVYCLRTRFGSRPVSDPVPARTRPVSEPTLRTRTQLPHDSHTTRPSIATDPTCFASLTFLPQGCLRSSVASSSSVQPGRPGRPGPGQVAAHLGSLRHQAPHCARPAQISIASRTMHSYWLGLTTTGSRRSWVRPEQGLARQHDGGPGLGLGPSGQSRYAALFHLFATRASRNPRAGRGL